MEQALEIDSRIQPISEGATEQQQGFYRFLYRFIEFADEHRSSASFFFILIGVVLSDVIFHNFLFEPYVSLVESLSGVQPGASSPPSRPGTAGSSCRPFASTTSQSSPRP